MSKFKFWIPAILYMAFIFWLSSRPAPDQIRFLPIIFKLKVVHLIEYGFLYFLFWWAISRTTNYCKLEIFILALTATVLYGLTDELHQAFVPQRTASLIDVAADGIGGLLAQAGVTILEKKQR